MEVGGEKAEDLLEVAPPQLRLVAGVESPADRGSLGLAQILEVAAGQQAGELLLRPFAVGLSVPASRTGCS